MCRMKHLRRLTERAIESFCTAYHRHGKDKETFCATKQHRKMIAFSSSLGFLCRLITCIIIVQNAGCLNCKQQSLLWHNYYRNIHQVGNVTWSITLYKKAKKWAVYLANNNRFIHEEKNPGNIFLSAGKPKEPCTRAVQLFYAEEKNYDYKTPEVFEGAGHFTQVIWKNTKQIGAFSKERKDGKTVVVVKYSPPGNVRGFFAKNVFPPRPNPDVRAGAMSVKGRGGAHFVMQFWLLGFLIIKTL